MKPVLLFIVGPSGVGKTHLADSMAVRGIVHVNFDRRDGNGVDIAGLRESWDSLLNDREPRPLADALREMVGGVCTGAVITCPSGIMPSNNSNAPAWYLSRTDLAMMKDRGLQTVILYGRREDCLNSFLERERRLQSTLKEEDWVLNNSDWFNGFRETDFSDCVHHTFHHGERRSTSEVTQDIFNTL